MAASTNSGPNSTPIPVTEPPADLSQNQDEALDLALAMGSLGGLRHAAACEAAERSHRRFDDRNHRLHEARMRRLGLEGEEREEEEMSQQVLIRSPIVHNHYQSPPPAQPVPSSPPPTPATQATPQGDSRTNTSWLPYVLTALIGGGLGAGAGSLPWLLSDKPAAVAGEDADTKYVLEPMKISGGEVEK